LNDEFLIKIDEILEKIVFKLPEQDWKQFLFKIFTPYMQVFKEEDDNVVLCIDSAQMFQVLESNL